MDCVVLVGITEFGGAVAISADGTLAVASRKRTKPMQKSIILTIQQIDGITQVWTESQSIEISSPKNIDMPISVAISSSILVVGLPWADGPDSSGVVYLFTRNMTTLM